jgi:hypothetical protein
LNKEYYVTNELLRNALKNYRQEEIAVYFIKVFLADRLPLNDKGTMDSSEYNK